MTALNRPAADTFGTSEDEAIAADGTGPAPAPADAGEATPPLIPTETGEDAAESAAHPS